MVSYQLSDSRALKDPGKILSLSFWKDEESIQQWRNVEMHRWAQSKGRESIFKDYLLRIAVVSRDYGMFDRKEDLTIVKSFMTQ